MNKIFTLLCLIFLGSFSSESQTFGNSAFRQWQQAKDLELQEAPCDLDSVLGFGFPSVSDSVLAHRRIYRKYANATAVYTYEFINGPLQLSSIDSTKFNANNKPLFNELWEFNEDSNTVVIKERTFYFPHNGHLQKDYFFPESILTLLGISKYNDIAFDSVIQYTKSFFTGVMEPKEKTEYHYNTEGQLIEELVFSYDAIGSQSWYPSRQIKTYYNTFGRTDYKEEYNWNLTSFTLKSHSQYSYDSNDSLSTILSTNKVNNQNEEKLEMNYDVNTNSTTATNFVWNTSNQQWIESISLFGDYDNQGRIEVLESIITFFGSTDGGRYEFFYLGNEACPWSSKIYEYESGGSWAYQGRFYNYPFVLSQTTELKTPVWTIFPNPASNGINILAPKGNKLQIVSLQGTTLYQGFATGNTEYIDLNGKSGPLFITIAGEKTVSTQMVVVNHY